MIQPAGRAGVWNAHRVAVLEQALAAIDAAFASAPRPADDALLHADCCDDGDIAALYEFAHWRDVPDDVVANEYAALSFLGPAGYRHFIAAYMSFSLRHLGAGYSAVDSTIWSLTASEWEDETADGFRRSKWSLFDDAQRAAVVSFLDAVRELTPDDGDDDAERALQTWDGSSQDDDPDFEARAEGAETGQAVVRAWFDALNRRDADAMAALMAPGAKWLATAEPLHIASDRAGLSVLLTRIDERIGETGELALLDVLRFDTSRFALIAETSDETSFSATHELDEDGRILSVSHCFLDLPT
jgi:hypothetical protein